MESWSGIRPNALIYIGFLNFRDSASQWLDCQKGAVKRLCRGTETLLSRPGRGAACASPIAAICCDFQDAAERF
jgi:hypothetical protein